MPTTTTPYLKIPKTSVSRLNSFNTCSTFFQNKYVHKLTVEEEDRTYFIKGTLAHSSLQELLDPETETKDGVEAVTRALAPWLEQVGVTNIDFDDLIEAATALSRLLYRASDRCTQNCIRTGKGEVPKDVWAYPPRTWTDALHESGFASRFYEMNIMAVEQNPVFESEPITQMVGEVFFWISNFRLPTEYKRTVAVELEISTEESNLVLFPGKTDLYWNAFIDWLWETQDGRLVLMDHKTSKKMPPGVDVFHHFQLAVYVYLYHELTGRWVDLIGIHHIRSGQFLSAEVDPKVIGNVISHYRDVQKAIDAGIVVKHSPEEYNSPCVKRDWGGEVIREICPYLETCWPVYNDIIQVGM